MTLGDLLLLWRKRLTDTAKPYLWSDDDGVFFANQAITEACERALLIEDDSRTGSVCNLSGKASTATYPLHPSIIEVRSVTWNGRFLEPIARETLNDSDQLRSRSGIGAFSSYFTYPPWDNTRDWSTLVGEPRFFIDPQEKYLTLVRIPVVDAPIHLSVYRRPVDDLTLDDIDTDLLDQGIPTQWHQQLVAWMEHLAFDSNDLDKGDPSKASAKEAEFTRSFGIRPDANLRRMQRARRSNQVRMNPSW